MITPLVSLLACSAAVLLTARLIKNRDITLAVGLNLAAIWLFLVGGAIQSLWIEIAAMVIPFGLICAGNYFAFHAELPKVEKGTAALFKSFSLISIRLCSVGLILISLIFGSLPVYGLLAGIELKAQGISLRRDTDYRRAPDMAKVEKGDSFEEMVLAYRYVIGDFGFAQDYDQAIKWFKIAAEQGDSDAQVVLGNVYKEGSFKTKQDYKESFKWFQLAANQDDERAQDALALEYKMGWGVQKNYEESYFWYSLEKSRRHATDGARWGVAETEKFLSPEQIAEVKKRVVAWKPVSKSN